MPPIIAEPWLEDELVVFAAPNSPLLAGSDLAAAGRGAVDPA